MFKASTIDQYSTKSTTLQIPDEPPYMASTLPLQQPSSATSHAAGPYTFCPTISLINIDTQAASSNKSVALFGLAERHTVTKLSPRLWCQQSNSWVRRISQHSFLVNSLFCMVSTSNCPNSDEQQAAAGMPVDTDVYLQDQPKNHRNSTTLTGTLGTNKAP